MIASHATEVVRQREQSLLVQLGVALAHQRLHQACSLLNRGVKKSVVGKFVDIVSVWVTMFETFRRRTVLVGPAVGVNFRSGNIVGHANGVNVFVVESGLSCHVLVIGTV